MSKKKTEKKAGGIPTQPRWMTSCDVARYNLTMPDKLKSKLKKEAEKEGMSLSNYICEVLYGNIERK